MNRKEKSMEWSEKIAIEFSMIISKKNDELIATSVARHSPPDSPPSCSSYGRFEIRHSRTWKRDVTRWIPCNYDK